MTDMDHPQHRRKATSLFIHKEMQREFSFVLIVLLILSSFFVALTIHYTIQHFDFTFHTFCHCSLWY